MLKIVEVEKCNSLPLHRLPAGAVGKVLGNGINRNCLVVKDSGGGFTLLGWATNGKVNQIKDTDGLSVEVLTAGTLLKVDYTGVAGF